MNKLYTKCLILLVCIVMLLAIGCAKQEEDGSVSPTDPTTITTSDTKVTLTVKSASVSVKYKVNDGDEKDLVKAGETEGSDNAIPKDAKVELILYIANQQQSAVIDKLSSDLALTLNYNVRGGEVKPNNNNL